MRERLPITFAAAGFALWSAAALDLWSRGETRACLLIAGGILALALAALMATRFRPDRVDDTPIQAQVADRGGEPPAAPSSLAFLVDPFAIPPPVLADMQAIEPFVDTLCGQIEGIQSDVADSVASVVRGVEAINAMSRGQRDRIQTSLDEAGAMRQIASAPGEIVDRLSIMLDERDRLISRNFDGLQALAEEFHELRGAVDVISQIADKAFFLAVNASVEAHHQGRTGAAFGLIATEMRSLASQTSEGARQVGQSINSFAARMNMQIAAAKPGEGQQGKSEIGELFEELNCAQSRMLSASEALGGAIDTIDAGHDEMVLGLSEILGNLQFQDVMRQRLEQVFNALRELDALVQRSRVGEAPERSLHDVLENQRKLYVMDSQRDVHGTVMGEPDRESAISEKIELF